jgi:hypothetical protein
VPDFGDRFCVYQIVDLRTDSFTQIGKTYGSTPGFYLLAGPNRQGGVAAGISKVSGRRRTRPSSVRAFFQDGTAEDKRVIQDVPQQVLIYPLSEYDGRLKSIDWGSLPHRHGHMGGPRQSRSRLRLRRPGESDTLLRTHPPRSRTSRVESPSRGGQLRTWLPTPGRRRATRQRSRERRIPAAPRAGRYRAHAPPTVR